MREGEREWIEVAGNRAKEIRVAEMAAAVAQLQIIAGSYTHVLYGFDCVIGTSETAGGQDALVRQRDCASQSQIPSQKRRMLSSESLTDGDFDREFDLGSHEWSALSFRRFEPVTT